MSAPKPPLVAELLWLQDLRFGATSGSNAIVLDGDSVAGHSPVHLLGIALAGCMAIDLVDILRKGRHQVDGLRTTLTGERAPEPPRRLTAVTLHFHLRGDIPPAAIERAVALSRDKYCSVWHSLRQDIDLDTAFTLVP